MGKSKTASRHRVPKTSPPATAAAPASEKYNFKLGPVTTDVAGKFEAEYNDNISLTDSGKVDDTILRFGITSKTVWPITELNSLSLDIDAAYRYYLDNTELNSNENFLDISPGSELALKWWIKVFTFKIYVQFSYSIDSADARVFDPTSSTILNNVTDFGRIENRAGLDVLWDLNDLKVYAGYARDTVNPDDAEFSSLDEAQLPESQPPRAAGQSLETYLEDIEKGVILEALEATRWNKTAAARRLGITFRALRYRLKKS